MARKKGGRRLESQSVADPGQQGWARSPRSMEYGRGRKVYLKGCWGLVCPGEIRASPRTRGHREGPGEEAECVGNLADSAATF